MAQKIRLGDLLIDCNIITDEQLGEALKYQKEHGLKLGEALIEMGLTTEDDIIWAIGNQLGISQIYLSPDMVDPSVIGDITPEFAQEYRIMPLYKAGKDFSVCMVDPLDTRPIEYLETHYGVNVLVSICTSDLFNQTYEAIYGGANSVSGVAEGEMSTGAERSIERGMSSGMEGVEKIVNYMLGQAIKNKFDSIHSESSDKGVVVRFRNGSILGNQKELPTKIHAEVVARLKALANIPADLPPGPKFGHFHVNVSGNQINFQAVFYPTIDGEMFVLKLKDYNSIVSSQMSEDSKNAIKQLFVSSMKNHGVLYVTGPRESGRTTTLYCVLQGYDSETHKLVTIENPVALSMPLTTQIQVGQNGIKTQNEALQLAMMIDSDVIYLDSVGDNRIIDEIGYAAIGGKTVFTTFLACDAPSAAVKLLSTGADPIVMASSLCGIANQRLVKTLCPKCKKAAAIPPELLELVSDEDKEKQIFKPVGCEACGNTGYAGKTLIVEYLPATAKLREMFREKSTYSDFRTYCKEQGIKNTEEQALELVLKGEVSADEFMRLF